MSRLLPITSAVLALVVSAPVAAADVQLPTEPMSAEDAGVIDEAMANQNACCAGAAATAIAAAGRLGAKRAQTVVYATSYDKRPADSFVGYVGIVFD